MRVIPSTLLVVRGLSAPRWLLVRVREGYKEVLPASQLLVIINGNHRESSIGEIAKTIRIENKRMHARILDILLFT